MSELHTLTTDILKYVNLILVPVSIWILRLEHRLTRIETILEVKKERKKEG